MAGMLGVGATRSRLLRSPLPLFTRRAPLHLAPHPDPISRRLLFLPSRTLTAAATTMAATNGTAAADPIQEQPKAAAAPSPAPLLLKVKKLSANAVLPSRGSALAAGYDLSSAVEAVVPARGKALVATDLSVAVPHGTYARIAPRSGLAWKHSIDVGAGVVDADYRGPVGVVLFNHSDADFAVKPGDRVAQLVVERIATPDVAEVDDLDATVRGEGGFGSTGV
ncbi:deoxyuridine 5'-triphosphate nucleotidohydrolase-like [Triticum urartu]|uniref:Deoxyuridine 5'-triphosphate nucleotidohydrolase n=1 Tax=Triticum urartu TaxID=4572 RepID=A0A8R7UDL3_TRIUA|nr:deoxyuridine 5'-triphosphate nucleotidohydrolase-like [Triticum urartu]